MGTWFYLESVEDSPLDRLTIEAMAETRAKNVGRQDGREYAVPDVTFQGLTFHYDREVGQWCYGVNDLWVEVPPELSAVMGGNIRDLSVSLSKNFAVVGSRAPYQGI